VGVVTNSIDCQHQLRFITASYIMSVISVSCCQIVVASPVLCPVPVWLQSSPRVDFLSPWSSSSLRLHGWIVYCSWFLSLSTPIIITSLRVAHQRPCVLPPPECLFPDLCVTWPTWINSFTCYCFLLFHNSTIFKLAWHFY